MTESRRPRGKDVADWVKDHTGRAALALARHPVPDAAIHDARKRIKRARAGLRLVRGTLGRRRYRTENLRLRDAARPLSAVRDRKVLVEALDRVTRRALAADRAAIRRLREALVAGQARSRRAFTRDRSRARRVVAALRASRAQAADWPRAPWSALRKDLKRLYRAGRKAFAAARARRTVVALHEWRKQVKYLWHQLEIVRPLRPAAIGRLARRMHDLADRLGEDHDFALLARRVRTLSGAGAARARSRLLARIEARRRGLQSAALRLGGTLYAAPPREFVARLEARGR